MVAARLAASLCLLVGFSLQVDVKSAKEAGKAGNFMEDEQWLSTISQYSRKIKHWNRFRDVSCAFFFVLFQKRVCGDIWRGLSWGVHADGFLGGYANCGSQVQIGEK